MAQDEIRLGIIGMGLDNMASTFVMLNDVEDLRYRITAICSVPQQTVDDCMAKFDVPFGTTDFRELVARDDVDVVCVFSPDHLHAAHAAAALEAGKHVVCTKPMVTSLDDAKKLVKLVARRKAKFLVGQTMRFDRQFLAAKKLFDDGEIGELIALESFYLHDMRPIFDFTPWRLTAPQDFMFGGCVHSIDVLRAFGGDVDEVHAISNSGGMTAEYPIDDNFFLNVRFASGAIGRVSGLYGIVHPPTPMMQFGLFGKRGSLQAEFTDNEPGEIRVVLDKWDPKKPEVTAYEPERDLSAYGHGATVIRYMRHFQDCLDSGADPSPSVIDGAKSVAVGWAARESIKTGKAVKVFNNF